MPHYDNYEDLSADNLIDLFNKGLYKSKEHLASCFERELSPDEKQIRKLLHEKGQKYLMVESLDETIIVLSNEIRKSDSINLVIYPNCVSQTDHLVVKRYPTRRITHLGVGQIQDYKRGDLTSILDSMSLPYKVTFQYD
jgi:hypothetical protein